MGWTVAEHRTQVIPGAGPSGAETLKRVSPDVFLAVLKLEQECRPGISEPFDEERWLAGLYELMPDLRELAPGTTVHIKLEHDPRRQDQGKPWRSGAGRSR
jgi:hypothetical protein